ncbi:hypothetical protein [Ilumatobacter sp.]|jgi:hypothetical protein|uniref:hypothetical protein n=1 Tax=Ilumatobacter sp. TaxID=1967498 RepID=UPI0030B3DB1E|tara:strand:- start:12 stop:194 length:183 start_codon:yes stop_codon:yes gene_type:complete
MAIIGVPTDAFGPRDLALRMPFFVAGVLNIMLFFFNIMLFFFAVPKLTTAKIEAIRTGSE